MWTIQSKVIVFVGMSWMGNYVQPINYTLYKNSIYVIPRRILKILLYCLMGGRLLLFRPKWTCCNNVRERYASIGRVIVILSTISDSMSLYLTIGGLRACRIRKEQIPTTRQYQTSGITALNNLEYLFISELKGYFLKKQISKICFGN